MEIDISNFFADADPSVFSASIAETGLKDIGKQTWASACEAGESTPLLTTAEEREALRRYVKNFGAWSYAEIAAWSDAEVNALFIQLVSSDMREAGLSADSDDADWADYERRAENGECSGNIFRSGASVFYSLSN